MKAHLISIGNELTGGATVDTNSPWLARQLATAGIVCTRHVTIADELEPIRDALRAAAREAGVVIVTGGLGPTADDLTRDALAAALDRPLVLHEPSLRRIEAYFAARRRTMHEGNRRQAMFPVGATPLDNDWGTAPGLHAELGRAHVFCLPGVPYEMKAMFEARVRPRLPSGGGAIVLTRTLRTFGMSESEVGERIADLMRRDRNPTVGTSAAEMVISIRIVAHASSMAEARGLLDADAQEIGRRLGMVVFADEGQPEFERAADAWPTASLSANASDACVTAPQSRPVSGPDRANDAVGRAFGTLPANHANLPGDGPALTGTGTPDRELTLADAVARLLFERRQTIAVAESCTGGLLAKCLTDVPGSSAYFLEGVVTYSNAAKTRLLGVPAELIAAHGAVSPQVAEAMATNCRRLAGADIALAITGIAGPAGGTTQKPVGLVYVAMATGAGTIVKELRLGENLARAQIRDRAVKAALNLLRLKLAA